MKLIANRVLIQSLILLRRLISRRISLIFLLIVSTLITSLTPTLATPRGFNDIEDHWAQLCIQQLEQRNILSGYPDGSFRPSEPVTRAEFAAMVTKAFPDAPIVRQGGEFFDLKPTYWGIFPIRQAFQTGFMSGYPGDVFKPNQNIPRVEVLVALVSGLKYFPTQPVSETLANYFTDANAIPGYAQEQIAAATENKLVVNYPDVRQLKPNQWASRGEVAAFLCQALKTTGVVPSQYIAANPEIRGVWLTNIDSDVLFSRQNTENAINQLAALNFNTVYPTVWNWGYTLYPSKVAQKVTGKALDPTEGLQNRNVLAEIIDTAHKKKIAVIPWFEFGFMAPADSELAKRHPDWLTQRQNGDKIWWEGNVHQRVWLNPLHPQVQDFIENLIVEVVKDYDIDGIQLDDHFGYPADFGYDPLTVKLYQKEHSGQNPPTDPQDPDWIRWRADKITAYMEQVFKAIKQQNSAVIVSVSPNPQEFSYNSYLLDWEKWERQGLIEELVLQVYRTDLAKFIEELQQPEVQAAKTHIPVGIGVLAGIKPRPVAIATIQEQVETMRNQGFAGLSFFFYESLWNLAPESTHIRQAALEKLFPTAVERPNLREG